MIEDQQAKRRIIGNQGWTSLLRIFSLLNNNNLYMNFYVYELSVKINLKEVK